MTTGRNRTKLPHRRTPGSRRTARRSLGTSSAVPELYQHLLQLQADAFEARQFEVAYHLLAATLHLTEELGDPRLIAEVEGLAGQSQRAIDRLQPDHRISTNAARVRGNVPVFASLQQTAAAARVRAEAEQKRRVRRI